MTTTGNLSGEEIPKRLFGSKPSKEEKRQVLKDLILDFDKKKKKKKKKLTAGDIIRRKNLEDMSK